MDDVVRGICRILEPHPSHVILKNRICSFKGKQVPVSGRNSGGRKWMSSLAFSGHPCLGLKVGESHPTLPDILKQQVCPLKAFPALPGLPKRLGIHLKQIFDL